MRWKSELQTIQHWEPALFYPAHTVRQMVVLVAVWMVMTVVIVALMWTSLVCWSMSNDITTDRCSVKK